MAKPPMHKMAFPVETPEAQKFWASRHLCNRLKAIIAFSLDMEDANNNLRRFGYQSHLRFRALTSYGNIVARPKMDTVAFTPLDIPWWVCLDDFHPYGHWAVWDDKIMWDDKGEWKEWIPDPIPPTP